MDAAAASPVASIAALAVDGERVFLYQVLDTRLTALRGGGGEGEEGMGRGGGGEGRGREGGGEEEGRGGVL